MAKIIEPEIPVLFDKPLLTKKRAFLVSSAVKSKLKATFLDDEGAVWSPPTGTNIKARFAEAVMQDNLAEVDGLSLEPDNTILVDVPETISDVPAIYEFSLGAFDNNTLIHCTDYYIYLEPTIWMKQNYSGIPAYSFVKQSLRDSSIFENELTQQYQFYITDVCKATIDAVARFNRTPPNIPVLRRNTANFPDFHLLLVGISIYLFGNLLEHYRKNSLMYNAAGLQINDNKLNEYSVAYAEAVRAFDQEAMHKKAQANTYRGWRIIG